MSEREPVVEPPFASDCCQCVEKPRTVLPLTAGIRDGVVQLVSSLGSAVLSARAELGSIIASALRCGGRAGDFAVRGGGSGGRTTNMRGHVDLSTGGDGTTSVPPHGAQRAHGPHQARSKPYISLYISSWFVN